MSITIEDNLSKTIFYSQTIMLVTSVHHIYGAILYETPWRLHVLFFSLPVMLITIAYRRWALRKPEILKGPWYWLVWGIILVFSLLLIGFFEGLYNHVLKNVLYFTGTPLSTLHRMFPPPKYVLPDDLLFEFSGVMQGVLAILLLPKFLKMTKAGAIVVEEARN